MELCKEKYALMIGPDLNAQGGVSSVARGYFEHGISEYYHVKYIATTCEGSPFKKLWCGFKAYLKCTRLLSNASVLHIHVGGGVSLARKRLFAKAAKRRNVPVIAHVHDPELRKTMLAIESAKKDKILAFYRCLSDIVVVLSEEWREFFSKEICDPQKIRVVHNGVEVPKEPLISYESHHILFLGRLDSRKSPEVLIEALSLMDEDFSDWVVDFAGDGDSSAYEAIAQERGVKERVVFHGWLSGDNREEIIRNASIFCLPSKNEGMPMSLLEAMSFGIASVSTPVGGIPQIIKNGRNGYLFPIDDSVELSRILLNLMEDSEKRKMIGMRGRDTVLEQFNVKTSIEAICELYNELS